ncbi:hypothetical protein T11_4928 [Trichinella zimbabwensis]|uniref:Uncharacterized protein n=1 Tax=Trichinella zimbabwensis TaxID=268475 RepID=A0A0V1GU46_9BILA|nr:hypothetical protein T11_4928 [Trichinella zimbabwensis]
MLCHQSGTWSPIIPLSTHHEISLHQIIKLKKKNHIMKNCSLATSLAPHYFHPNCRPNIKTDVQAYYYNTISGNSEEDFNFDHSSHCSVLFICTRQKQPYYKKLIISRRCFYHDRELTLSSDDFPHCKSNVKTIEEVKIRYECIMHRDINKIMIILSESNCIGRVRYDVSSDGTVEITSRQSNSAVCGIHHAKVVLFSMMSVLMATRVPLPIKAFPWRLSVHLFFTKKTCMLYGSSRLRHNNCSILPLWYYELASMGSKGGMKISIATKCVNAIRIAVESQLTPLLSKWDVGVRFRFQRVMDYVNKIKGRSVLAVVAMKVIHSGSQFRVVYGKEIMVFGSLCRNAENQVVAYR